MSKLLRMPNINNITISGNLTRDIEAKYTANNVAIARIAIAANHYYRDENGEFKEQVSFIDAVAFGDTAQRCIKDLRKGSPVILEGYLKTRQYVDQNNQNRKATEINVTKIYPLEKIENPNAYPQNPNPYPQNTNTYQQNPNSGYPPPPPPPPPVAPRPPQAMPADEGYLESYTDSQTTVDDTNDVPF